MQREISIKGYMKMKAMVFYGGNMSNCSIHSSVISDFFNNEHVLLTQ